MFKESPVGKTYSCSHENKNPSGICDKCLGHQSKEKCECECHKNRNGGECLACCVFNFPTPTIVNEGTQQDKLREKLAELEHEQWIAWSRNIATTEKITPERYKRWEELWRPYEKLTEAEKDQDREWADKVLAVIDNPKGE